MALQVPPELEERITARARADQRDPQTVLAELLERVLDESSLSPDEHAARIASLRSDIELARDQVRRGDVVTMTSGQIEALLNGSDG